MLKNDPIADVLYIDLSKKRFWVERREELFERYIGGVGVATKLLEENCPKNCDALDEENPIILAVGPLTSLFPLASKTVALFKSPLNNNLGESYCGGRSAVAIRMAGYGAIVITGKSDIPIYLTILNNKVQFKDASSIWGMQNVLTIGRIIREREPYSGYRTIMRIGGAGENLVRYACVTTETYRHFGRLGLGCVFGSKKLKAILIGGKRSLPIKDRKNYKEIYDDIYRKAVNSSLMKKYHDLGTAANVISLNDLKALPTKNLQKNYYEKAEELSGENLANKYLGRRIACSHCPVGCIHLAALREPYEKEPYFYKTIFISYDYEPIYALGCMLKMEESNHFLKVLDEVETFGLDAMSTGVVLAWATEAMERGLISKNEVGLELRWGDYNAYIEAIRSIVFQPNDFYKALAKGVEYASSLYGGKEFALSFGGNEMAGYHTGPAFYAGIILGARHSHLDNAGYSLDQKLLIKEKISPQQLAEKLITEERWRSILNSLIVCLFAREIYTPEIVSKALSVLDFEISLTDLEIIGREIHDTKYKFKFRENFSFDKIYIPKRIFETETPAGYIDKKYLEDVIKYAEDSLKDKTTNSLT